MWTAVLRNVLDYLCFNPAKLKNKEQGKLLSENKEPNHQTNNNKIKKVPHPTILIESSLRWAVITSALYS